MYPLTAEQSLYIKKLAQRYVQFRKSASIDRDDLISAATTRWWQFCIRNTHIQDETLLTKSFYHHVKGAMRDVVRDSSPVKVTRTMQAQMRAYQTPYTVELDHAVDILAGEPQRDVDQWLDVVNGLKHLSERDRIILSLYFEQDLTFSEIAEVLDVAVSTVTRAYHRSIDSLKKILSESENDAKKLSK